jgi:hypothetical protein
VPSGDIQKDGELRDANLWCFASVVLSWKSNFSRSMDAIGNMTTRLYQLSLKSLITHKAVLDGCRGM